MKTDRGSLPQFFGGLNSVGRRKTRRPLSYRQPIQICLKSEKARGDYHLGLSKHRFQVKAILKRQARRHGIRLRSVLNLGNQIQMVIRARDREGFQSFLRSSTALIARKVTGAKKGKAFGKFWLGLASSRILSSHHQALGIIRFLSLLQVKMRRTKSSAERNALSVELWDG